MGLMAYFQQKCQCFSTE